MESKFTSQVASLERESDDLKEQVESLTLKVHDKIAQVRAAKVETENAKEELQACREKLANMTRLKNQLSEALEHEQNQRHALLLQLENQQGDQSVHFDSSMRALEDENASLREETQKLRFAVGIQSERSKERRRAHEKEVAATASKLERLEQKFAKVLQASQAYRNENEALRASITQGQVELDRVLHDKTLLKSEFDKIKHDYAHLRKQKGLEDSIVAEKEYQNECLKQEISRIADRFERSIAEERIKSERSFKTKDKEIAALQAKCQMLMETLHSKERKLTSQGSLLRSLDSSLDKLIAG